MYRFFSIAAVATLTLHFLIATSYSLKATGTSCDTSSIDGCSCQAYTCEITGETPGYYDGYYCVAVDSCYAQHQLTIDEFLDVVENGAEVPRALNMKVWSAEGPLVGGGCEKGNTTWCKQFIEMSCAWDDICDGYYENRGSYQPCFAIE